LSESLPKEPILLDVDPTRISQVICNLLVNAAKYTSPGGRIEISARQAGTEASITVADNGRGLNPEALESLFELFWRAPDLDSSSGPSMGIGLSLARNIVELHHGTLTAFSDGPDTGSRFMITLPVAAEAQRDPAAVPDEGPWVDKGDDDLDRSKLRILLADDNEDVVWTQAAVLAARGFQVRTAVHGEQAWQILQELQPDVAVLDIAMPGLTGIELAARIRRETWGRGTLLIAATGWGTDLDRQRSLEAGFDEHLVKPIKLDDLTRRLAARARSVVRETD
jgi:two-component system CheB/CheR fusion protein